MAATLARSLSLLALLLVAFWAVDGPSRAAAHANLDRAEPAADSKLTQSPATLTLYFTQAIAPASSWVQIRDAADKETPVTLGFEAADRKMMVARLSAPLAPGVYTIKWQSLSADDDDYTQGSYKLTVLRPDGSDPGASTGNPSQSSSGGGSSVAVYAGAAVVLLVVAGAGFWLLGRRKSA